MQSIMFWLINCMTSFFTLSKDDVMWWCMVQVFGAQPRLKWTPSRCCAKFWWLHHHDTDIIIMAPGKNMNNSKNCPISLIMLHTGGLYHWFTAPLILISKNFQSKYIYTLNSALCAPFAWAAIKQLLFGAW